MSIQLAIANIALDTATVSRQGFGDIIFIGKHNYFEERVRIYTSTKSMVDDGIPTTSGVYAAGQIAFSQTPSPTSIKIGRQESTSILTPKNIANGTEYKITLSAKDAVTAEFSYTASVPTDDEEAIVNTLKAAIDADTDIAAVVTTTKVGTGADTVLELSQTISGTDWFTVSGLLNLDESFKEVSTESAADTLNAIQLEDDEFYYITAEDHSQAFQEALATDVESKLKFYKTSTSDVNHLLATPTGALATMQTNGYFRSNGSYHHDADTLFPEVGAVAEIAFAVTGTVLYDNRIIAGVSPSLNGDGRVITSTQQANLKGINADFFARVGSFNTDPVIIKGGKAASGEWIDNVVARDNMQVDIEADFTNLLIRQKNRKIAFNNKGANEVYNTLSQTLSTYTEDGGHNFIEDDFVITIPDEKDFNLADKASGTFRQITFKATLTGGIRMVEITGTLSY